LEIVGARDTHSVLYELDTGHERVIVFAGDIWTDKKSADVLLLLV